MLDFLTMKQELVAAGRTFTPADLRLLRYPDVKRAAIGDAGAAACTQELVEAELERRLAQYRHVTPEMFPGFTTELERQGMFADVFRRVFPAPPAAMEWACLPTQLRAHMLIRCLRAHVDQPGPRLSALDMELAALERNPHIHPKVTSIAVMLRGVVAGILAQVAKGERLDLVKVRRRFQGFDVLQTGLSAAERTALFNLTIRGYHCSHGCFLPMETPTHD